jgi:valyl-tRNA synthetase
MAAMESQGRDVKMDEKRVEGYRNFATKLWNAARFCQSNGIGASTSLAAPQAPSRSTSGSSAKWSKPRRARQGDGRPALRRRRQRHLPFRMGQFCDWYHGTDQGRFDDETKRVAGWVLDQILVMLHPFMPFITEELWHGLGKRDYDLIIARTGTHGADREVRICAACIIRCASGSDIL